MVVDCGERREGEGGWCRGVWACCAVGVFDGEEKLKVDVEGELLLLGMVVGKMGVVLVARGESGEDGRGGKWNCCIGSAVDIVALGLGCRRDRLQAIWEM